MRKDLKILAVAAAVILPLTATSGLYAHESQGPAKTMSGSGMMGQGGHGGHGGHGGMMGMTGQMTEMMETCNKMMQSMMDTQGQQMPGQQMPRTMPQTPDTSG